jgi:chemotaxis protein MotB
MGVKFSDNPEPPIRIIRKKKGHGGPHGGAWKVAYADFVTAMMALFIVLWIMAQGDATKKAIANYFNKPAIFPGEGVGALPGSTALFDQKSLDEQIRIREREKMETMARQITEKLGGQASLKNIMNQVKIEIVSEGLRIELLESSETFFFDIGTAQLKKEATKILITIAQEVKTLPNRIILEGHTDSRPYGSALTYTNFELSADRANSARRVLVQNGVKDSQIAEIRGYADRKLRNQTDPYDLTNRRISIIIKFEGT